MKNAYLIPFACLLVAGSSQALVLDLPGVGSYTTPTVVTTAATFGGATFDISYTVGAIATGANPFAHVPTGGGQLGVGSDADIANHYATLEGNDNEGLSFTSLSVSNFAANGSGLVIADIENDLSFTGLTLTAVANNQDGVNISFTDYGIITSNVLLSAGGVGSSPATLDLTALSNYDASATGLYIEPDNNSSANRWAVTEIIVSVPEPASSALFALGLSGLAIRRRRLR